MSTCRVRLNVGYEPDLAGGRAHQYACEIRPALHVYFTHGLSRSVYVVPPSVLSSGRPGAEVRFSLDLELDVAAYRSEMRSEANLWALPCGAEGGLGAELPADSYLAFVCYVETATENGGNTCRTNAGAASFLLRRSIFDDAGRVQTAYVGERSVWQLTGETPLTKGFVRVHRVEFIGGGAAAIGTRFAKQRETDVYHLDEQQQDLSDAFGRMRKRMDAWIDESMSVFFGDAAILGRSKPKALRRIHCPYYTTNFGISFGAAYTLRLPRSGPPHHYYVRILRMALIYNDTRAEVLLDVIRAQRESTGQLHDGFRFSMKVYAEMLTMFSISMLYLSDFVNEGGETLAARRSSTDEGSLTRAVEVASRCVLRSTYVAT